MASVTEKNEYIKDHLRYEFLMLCHTLLRMENTKHELDWNAFYESFAVHARILYDFLTNEKDSRNFKASDYVEEFEADKRDAAISIFKDLNAQVFHLGKRRPYVNSDKVCLPQAQKVYAWIKANFENFIDQLSEPYRSNWHWDNADPVKVGILISLGSTPPGNPTQSSAPFVVSTDSIQGPR